eukprot:465342_1
MMILPQRMKVPMMTIQKGVRCEICEKRLKLNEKTKQPPIKRSSKIGDKDTEIANEELNVLEIGSKLARHFEINKQVLDKQIQNTNELKTKLFPLQSMIRLNEPIVKQKEEKELMSETRREEECLRNIRNQIETKQTDFIKHSTTSQAQTSRSYYTQHNDEGTNHVDTLWISSSFQSTVNQRKRQRYNV